MKEQAFSRNRAVSMLLKSPHGELKGYVEPTQRTGEQDPEFLARLTAWNLKNGKIRDSKVALPVISLGIEKISAEPEFLDNALAAFASLSPREMVRSMRFAYEIPGVSKRKLAKVAAAKLAALESKPAKFARVAMQHKHSLQEMYALSHTKANEQARQLVFGRGEKTIVGQLAGMSDAEAAGTILEMKIPFLAAAGALGKRSSSPVILSALMRNMTPTEVVTNIKRLEKLGVRQDAALRAELEDKMAAVSSSTTAILKTSKAAALLAGTETGEKLAATQERQLDAIGVKGNWLILADKSGSMEQCIEAARHVAATLARVSEGETQLTFFDTNATSFPVTGKSYEEISSISRFVRANGGTSIGIGVRHALASKFSADGIVIVTDGEENANPRFHEEYVRYTEFLGKEVPVYVYRIGRERNSLEDRCERDGISLQVFDIAGVDYYSLPNLILTMRTNMFSLSDEIMSQPLLRLADVL